MRKVYKAFNPGSSRAQLLAVEGSWRDGCRPGHTSEDAEQRQVLRVHLMNPFDNECIVPESISYSNTVPSQSRVENSPCGRTGYKGQILCYYVTSSLGQPWAVLGSLGQLWLVAVSARY